MIRRPGWWQKRGYPQKFKRDHPQIQEGPVGMERGQYPILGVTHGTAFILRCDYAFARLAVSPAYWLHRLGTAARLGKVHPQCCALRNLQCQVFTGLFTLLLQCSIKNAALQERGEPGWEER